MKLAIAENVRALRKGRKLTQEQLAEALGVTIGAVSKWESGASIPDVSLIVELARFFETSVDVLLGYEWRAETISGTVERIRTLRKEKRLDESCEAAEQALLKHPNSFEIVFHSALTYCMQGVERNAKRSYRRALALFERALELIGQNTDPKINEWTIRNHIAEIYLLLGESREALERLKQNNADGLNDGAIGETLIKAEHKPDEALPYLTRALINGVSRMTRLALGYANAYEQRKEYGAAVEVLTWMLGIVEGLRRPDAVSYLDREAALLSAVCATMALMAGEAEAARAYLRRAKASAERFDAAPEYRFSGMRFFHGSTEMTAFDDFGDTAMAGVASTIQEAAGAERLQGMWEALLAQ